MVGRDVFSFWEPLDSTFIMDVTEIALSSGIEVVSFFWAHEFSAYLNSNQYSMVQLSQINPIINKAMLTNSVNRVYSPQGIFFQDWITLLNK